MRIWITVIVLIAVGVTFQPTASAQSLWQKMKQSAKQAEKNAEAQSRQAHATQQTKSTTPSASAAAGSSATSGAAAQAPQAAVDLSSPALKALYRKLDVGGVQMGMTPQAAQAALQSRSRGLAPSSTPFAFTDLPNTRFISRIDFQQPGSMDEIVQLGLTLQPIQSEVLSIHRYTRYNENNLPTIANTLAALRAKYGPETTSKNQSSSQDTTLFWIFDGEGRLVPTNRARDPKQDLIGWCASGDIQLDVKTGLRNGGFARKKVCAPLTVVRAELHEWERTRKNSHGQSLPPGMLFQMDVTASSYPMLAKSVDATNNMLDAARNARQQKEKKDADQHVAPL